MVEAGIKTGIRIVTPNPQQIGADRIVDAVGAYEIYGGPVLVIDFGTATTTIGVIWKYLTSPPLRECITFGTTEQIMASLISAG